MAWTPTGWTPPGRPRWASSRRPPRPRRRGPRPPAPRAGATPSPRAAADAHTRPPARRACRWTWAAGPTVAVMVLVACVGAICVTVAVVMLAARHLAGHPQAVTPAAPALHQHPTGSSSVLHNLLLYCGCEAKGARYHVCTYHGSGLARNTGKENHSNDNQADRSGRRRVAGTGHGPGGRCSGGQPGRQQRLRAGPHGHDAGLRTRA